MNKIEIFSPNQHEDQTVLALAQQLDQSLTLTTQKTTHNKGSHSTRASTTSELGKKIWAAFFMSLLIPHGVSSSSAGSRERGYELEHATPDALLANQVSALNTYPLDAHEWSHMVSEADTNGLFSMDPSSSRQDGGGVTLWGHIDRLVNNIGSALFGPLGALLSFSSPTRALDVPKIAPYLIEPLPEGLYVKAVAAGLSQLAQTYSSYAQKDPEGAEKVLKASCLVGSMLVGGVVGGASGAASVGVVEGAKDRKFKPFSAFFPCGGKGKTWRRA